MLPLAQIADNLWRTWLYVTQTRTLAVIFGVGFAILAITLLIASRTRWGHAKPLTKCIALSVLAHVWLLMYALGSRAILPQGDNLAANGNMSVYFDDSLSAFTTFLRYDDASAGDDPGRRELMPWEQTLTLDSLPKPKALERIFLQDAITLPALLARPEPTPMPPLPELLASDQPLPYQDMTESVQALPSQESTSETLLENLISQLYQDKTQSPMSLQEILPPKSEFGVQQREVHVDAIDASLHQDNSSIIQSVASSRSPILPPEIPPPNNSRAPNEYRLRQAPNRLELSKAFGADADSEAAVEAGLRWLVSAQSPDGSWNAQQHGAGHETYALGESRFGTGEKADTGISGLALLAFLAAGHTHLAGEHRTTVQHGLEYLLRAQMPSGDLSGPKQVGSDFGVLNARMYCHGIATLALAESYAMTQDEAIRDALLRAIQYSINAQDIRGGGWRYVPRVPGDLSQFGWQAMALKSGELSGIEIPSEVKRRMRRFVDSCAAGQAGGLATYRPKEGRPSETMTAEGMACRLLLDYPTSLPAQKEATTLMMKHRPGSGEDNVYFWYYATLALFQLQDENWRVWNQALKQQLLASQAPVYQDNPGSWKPDGLWGGYGGRVYSTAMGCLCLEVYYRYLPLYQHANLARTPDLSIGLSR